MQARGGLSKIEALRGEVGKGVRQDVSAAVVPEQIPLPEPDVTVESFDGDDCFAQLFEATEDANFDQRGLFIGRLNGLPTPRLQVGELYAYDKYKDGDILRLLKLPPYEVQETVYDFIKERTNLGTRLCVSVSIGLSDPSLERTVGYLLGKLQVSYRVIAAIYNAESNKFQIELAHPTVKWLLFKEFKEQYLIDYTGKTNLPISRRELLRKNILPANNYDLHYHTLNPESKDNIRAHIGFLLNKSIYRSNPNEKFIRIATGGGSGDLFAFVGSVLTDFRAEGKIYTIMVERGQGNKGIAYRVQTI